MMSESEPEAGAAAAAARTPGNWRGGRLPRAEVDQRIESLLDIAVEEFAELGYAGTSLDRLVERSGVSKTTIYRRFGNKEGLFQTLVQRSLERTREALWAVTLDEGDPQGTVTRYVEAYTRAAVDVALGQTLLQVAVAERRTLPQFARTLMDNAVVGFEPLTDYFASLMKAGVLRQGDPLEAAFDLQALITHGFRVMVDDREFLHRPGRSAQIARTFLKGWA